MSPNYQSHPPFAAELDAPLYVNDHTYILEPPMENGRRNLWYHASLIPYSIVGSIHTFMGPLPRRIKKPHMLKDFFPTFPSYEPLVFVDAPFNFNFLKNIMLCSSPPIEDVDYIKWLNRIEGKNKHFWRNLGFFLPNLAITSWSLIQVSYAHFSYVLLGHVD